MMVSSVVYCYDGETLSVNCVVEKCHIESERKR
uniref:Uncharacterized protein n=1 Tax=Rhizophora mucronata TaxID=61149 RepID=A0A2P2PU95_RHIMU